MQLALHFTLMTFLLLHKYYSLHGGLCARYSHWPSACSWLLPFPFSCSSPSCRWLVTDTAVNYSGRAGIRYERGMSARQSGGECTHMLTRMIVSSYARQLHVLLLLYLRILLSINPISFSYFLCLQMHRFEYSTYQHAAHFNAKKDPFCICSGNKQHVGLFDSV